MCELVIVRLNCFNLTKVRPLFTLSHRGDPLCDIVNRGLTLLRLELCNGHYTTLLQEYNYIYFLHKYTCGDPGKNRPSLLVACQRGVLSGETVN